MSIAFSGVGVGSISCCPAMQALIETHGWRAACVAMGIVVLVVLVPLNLLLRRRPQDLGLAPDGDAPVAGRRRRPSNVVDARLGGDRLDARARDAHGALLVARARLLRRALRVVRGAGAPDQVPDRDRLQRASDAAWALGFVSLAGVPGQIALGQLSDRIGREWVWTIGCLGFAICYVALLALAPRPRRPAALYRW